VCGIIAHLELLSIGLCNWSLLHIFRVEQYAAFVKRCVIHVASNVTTTCLGESTHTNVISVEKLRDTKNLEEHVPLNTNVNYFDRETCGEKFCYGWNVKVHIRTAHGTCITPITPCHVARERRSMHGLPHKICCSAGMMYYGNVHLS